MFHVIPRAEQKQSPNRTILFEGGQYGTPISLFLMDAEPGQGPALHIHPYPETWIVHSGEAEFTVGEQKIMGKAGDIIVVDPETPHRFVNTGIGRLQMTCIHASDRVVQSWL
ncbi:cupin domain-containing protein [Ensifer adhaerens]|uniref:cupin domain-containing protein n=1 Tax=Ensifer adhaerens TaxID=106592 RepID=UPI0023A9975B|nr:cupin domain-containing protein [Ensifer adhaerens]WDZ78443.1 cupin domain-containing protein [Ensifer adhaerens]